MTGPAPRPLVVRFGALGDMVLLTPLLALLHRRYGLAPDVLSAGAWTPSLYAGHPDVRCVLLLGSRRRPYWSDPRQWRAVAQLRAAGSRPVYVCDELATAPVRSSFDGRGDRGRAHGFSQRLRALRRWRQALRGVRFRRIDDGVRIERRVAQAVRQRGHAAGIAACRLDDQRAQRLDMRQARQAPIPRAESGMAGPGPTRAIGATPAGGAGCRRPQPDAGGGLSAGASLHRDRDPAAARAATSACRSTGTARMRCARNPPLPR